MTGQEIVRRAAHASAVLRHAVAPALTPPAVALSFGERQPRGALARGEAIGGGHGDVRERDDGLLPARSTSAA